MIHVKLNDFPKNNWKPYMRYQYLPHFYLIIKAIYILHNIQSTTIKCILLMINCNILSNYASVIRRPFTSSYKHEVLQLFPDFIPFCRLSNPVTFACFST